MTLRIISQFINVVLYLKQTTGSQVSKAVVHNFPFVWQINQRLYIIFVLCNNLQKKMISLITKFPPGIYTHSTYKLS